MYRMKIRKIMKMMKMTKRMNNNRTNYLMNLSLMRKGVWWTRNFSSSHNKHKDAKGKPGEQKMSFSQKIEVDILNQCFPRFATTAPFLLLLLKEYGQTRGECACMP